MKPTEWKNQLRKIEDYANSIEKIIQTRRAEKYGRFPYYQVFGVSGIYSRKIAKRFIRVYGVPAEVTK